MKEKDINSLDHTTWRCQYHVVFAPKYRRLMIYGEIKVDIGKILRQLCQQKGIEIASILAKNAELMLFDEPEAGIDLWSFARLTETFRQLHDEGGHTIVIISHQERIIRLADEIVLIADGKVAGRGSVEEIYPQILADTVAGCNMLEVNGQC